MVEPPRKFHGKLMLFGEYGVLLRGQALTIPLLNFSAGLRFLGNQPNNDQASLNRQLKNYHSYLLEKQQNEDVDFGIDLHAFSDDLDQGLFLASDIPQGYGAGSSGALVAAVYSRYATRPMLLQVNPGLTELVELQKNLALLEGYFHGTSSGIDPLSCFLARPLLIDSQKNVQVVSLPKFVGKPGGGFFLIDTRLMRKTQNLVNIFWQKYRQADFSEMMEKNYKPLMHECINRLIAADWSGMMSALKKLSEIQMLHFSEMIPDNFTALWQQGLKNEHYTLKLCGAGGGGFIMGFASDYIPASQALVHAGSKIIPVEIPE